MARPAPPPPSGSGSGSGADPALRARKLRDMTMLLPIVGTVLFLPPAVRIVALDGMILGVPVAVAYVFAVWALLIAAARPLGRRLRHEMDDGPGGAATHGETAGADGEAR